jgi:hypothetical protein
MQSIRPQLDRMMGRLLFLEDVPAVPSYDPAQKGDAPNPQAETAERAFGFSLLFSGIRCVLQYAVLPFLLPAIGIAASAAVPVLMVINVLAIVSIFFSLRRFWKVGYKYRWQYLGVAIVALVLLAFFLVMDITTMQAG